MKVVVVVEAEGVVRNSPRNNQIHQYIGILEHRNNLHLVSMRMTTPIHHKRKGYRYQISPYTHTLPQFPCIVEEVATAREVGEEEMVVVEVVVMEVAVVRVVVVVVVEVVVRNSPMNNQIHQYIGILEHQNNLHLVLMHMIHRTQYKPNNYTLDRINQNMHTLPQFPCTVEEVVMAKEVEEEEMVVVVVEVVEVV